MKNIYLISNLLAITGLAVACSAGSTADEGAGGMGGDATGGSGSGGTPAGGGQGAGDGGAIVAMTRVCGPEDCLSYLSVFDSMEALEEAGQIDKTQAREVSYSQGRVYDGSLYLFSRGEQPTVTRWTVEPDLSLEEQETISFANTGTTIFCEICNVFGSPELAFHLDSSAGVLVSWNPTTMSIVDTSEIPESITARLEGGYADVLFPRVHDGRAYFNAGWSNSDVPEVVETAAVVAFDVDDPTPELEVIEDDRCGGTWAMAPFKDDAGNVYVMGDWNAGFYQIGILNPIETPACLLRIRPGEAEFDPDYYVNLLEVLDAKAVRNAFSMADGKLLVNILPASDPGLSTAEIEADPWAFYDIDRFRYVVLDLETLEATPVSGIGEVSAGSAKALTIDDRTLLQIYGEETADLYEITTDGEAHLIVNAGLNGDFDMIGRLR